MKVYLRQTALGYPFNVHYHGLARVKEMKIRLNPQISYMHLNMMVELQSIDIVFLCLGVLIIII